MHLTHQIVVTAFVVALRLLRMFPDAANA